MNCEQAKTELIAYLRGELDERQKRRLEEHLAKCPACRAEIESARKVLAWTASASDEAVVAKVAELIDGAIRARASDIHLEPQHDNSLLVRYRVDGVLHEVDRIGAAQRDGVMTRCKLLAQMPVAETGTTSNGRVRWECDDKRFDLRAALTPFVLGEGLVMRILDRAGIMPETERLGLLDDHLVALREMVHRPWGMVFFSGPVGSGKTTVLYSMLTELTNPSVKILTIEDPVECILPGINQAQVDQKTGLGFNAALRNFLRQDPDIIAVGDLRDAETLHSCAEATLTGHMMLPVIPAPGAAATLDYLRRMLDDDPLLAATLTGGVSCRLARKTCQECRTEYDPDPSDPFLRGLGFQAGELDGRKLVRGAGCASCRGYGYRGRMGLFEVLVITREISALIGAGTETNAVIEAARSTGFRTMREIARQRVLEGTLTADEVFRVLTY